MSTQAALDRAIELIDEGPFDLSTYEMCAATALFRAAAEQHPGSDIGHVYEPSGAYADVLTAVRDANAFLGSGDLLTVLHDGLWEIMRQYDTTAQNATLVAFRAARATVEPRELVLT